MTQPAVYAFGENLYLNLTMLCPTECTFCVKGPGGRNFRGVNLTLERPPEIEEIWKALLEKTALRSYEEFVFCGYGESTYRLDAMGELGRRIKRRFLRSRRRLNTVGLGSAIWGRDIVPELAKAIDAVSVSLNTANPAQWLKLHRPKPEFRQNGFSSVIDFARRCVAAGLDTTITAVELPGVDLKAVGLLSAELGAAFRPRPILNAGDLDQPPPRRQD